MAQSDVRYCKMEDGARIAHCAIALQRAFAAHEGEPLQVRVGLNTGEQIEEEGDLSDRP